MGAPFVRFIGRQTDNARAKSTKGGIGREGPNGRVLAEARQ
jgi:hypothetical protein